MGRTHAEICPRGLVNKSSVNNGGNVAWCEKPCYSRLFNST